MKKAFDLTVAELLMCCMTVVTMSFGFWEFSLSQMVEHTWAWAKGQGKVYTHPINKAEYVDLDVEKCRETQHARVREIASSSAFQLKDMFRVQSI